MGILERKQTGAVLHVQMNAPERLNALSDEMIAALHGTLDEVAGDRSVRAVVLSGAGKAFCAGHDLKQMTAGRQHADGGAAYFKDLFDRCAAMMARVQSLPQPVIAQVHGIATAAGCQLVATCDLAVAAHPCWAIADAGHMAGTGGPAPQWMGGPPHAGMAAVLCPGCWCNDISPACSHAACAYPGGHLSCCCI